MNSQFYDPTTPFSQSYLLSRIVRNAKRSQKISFFIRENRLNSFRGAEPVSVILQISRTTPLPATLHSLARLPSPKLSSCRSFSSPPVFYGGWNWPHRERAVADPQRSDPAASGFARVSSPRHFEELSLALWSQGTAQCGHRSRPTPPRTVPSLRSSPRCYCRCRYHSPVDLRSSRGSRRRLCPQKAPRPTFLRADYLQRRPMWPDSGNGTQSGQRPSHHRSFKLLKSNVGQTALFDCHHPDPTAIGRSLLRQKDHRSYRSGANRLCRFGQDDPSPQKHDGRRSLSAVWPRLGSCRIHLYAFSVAKRASVCGRAQSGGFRTRIYSATTFYLQAVHLPPSVGHQFGAHPGGGLAFLLRPGIPGASAARVQGLLYDGQDSDPQFLGQCRLHGDGSVVLRFGLGFPVLVFARRSTQLEHRHPAARALVVACRVGQTRQSQCFGAACQVPTPRSVPQNSAGYRESQTHCLNLNRSATLLTTSYLVGNEN